MDQYMCMWLSLIVLAAIVALYKYINKNQVRYPVEETDQSKKDKRNIIVATFEHKN